MRRWLRLALSAGGTTAAAGVIGFAAGAIITDRLEQDNKFCIACHSLDKPLHAEVYRSFYLVGGELFSLAAAHNVKGQVKCIDCHIGADAKDYLIVKAIAGVAAMKWVVGAYEDPEALVYPLGDRTCLKCHTDGGMNRQLEKAFHNRPNHRNPRTRCSDCHRSHLVAPVETRFLVRAIVKPWCDRCHQAVLGIAAG